MVQPTTITSASPSLSEQDNEPQSSQQATPKAGGNRGKNAARKGKTEQVGESDGANQNDVNLHVPIRTPCVKCFIFSRGCEIFLRKKVYLNSGRSKSATVNLFLDVMQQNMLWLNGCGCMGSSLKCFSCIPAVAGGGREKEDEEGEE